MFLRSLILYILFILALVAAMGKYVFHHSDQRVHEYQDLLDKNRPVEKLQQTQQRRFNVHKQIISSKVPRLETVMKAEESLLTWEQSGKSSELVEYFHQLKYLSQEQVFEQPPKQLLRALQAREALFHYHSKELMAEEIEFVRFEAPGFQLTENMNIKPVIQGKAKSAVCNFEESPSFNATDVKIVGENW